MRLTTFPLDSAGLEQYLTLGAARGGRDGVLLMPPFRKTRSLSGARRASRRPGDPFDAGTAYLELHFAWREGAPLRRGGSRPRGAPPAPGRLPELRAARPGPAGGPRGPTVPPARLGPARMQWEPAGPPPDSVSPGSPQLPVVFLLLEQPAQLRHGRARRANSRVPPSTNTSSTRRRRTERPLDAAVCLAPPVGGAAVALRTRR